jgi:hypothetical protein
VRLVRLGAIEGQITGLRGRPAKVLAMARSIDRGSMNGVWKPVVDSIVDCCEPVRERGFAVDDSGNFRIPDLPPGTYALLISYGNGLLRYPEAGGGFESGGDGATLKVQIPIPSGAGHDIEGKIDLPDSRSWCWITLSSPDQPALALATTISDSDHNGEFAFRGIVPGIYELLAVPGSGERGKRSPTTEIYGGFARTIVDIRDHDARGVTLTPQRGIRASTALQHSVALPRSGYGCGFAGVTLTPVEDWGVNLERKLQQVKIVDDGTPPSPEPIDGLAPARYGITIHSGECLIAGHPVLDLSDRPTGGVEAKVNEPGIIRGHAGVPGDRPSPRVVILIPDDFTEGLPLLPANWFRGPSGWSTGGAEYGAAGFAVQSQFYLAGRGGYLPYVRIYTVEPDAHFEIANVPAGRYRIALRTAEPAPESQDMQRVEIPPGGVAEIDLPEPSGQ